MFSAPQGTSMTVKVLIAQSCLTLCDPMDCYPPGSSVHRILQAIILRWIFPTQVSNPGLPLCKQILHHLSYQEGPGAPQEASTQPRQMKCRQFYRTNDLVSFSNKRMAQKKC